MSQKPILTLPCRMKMQDFTQDGSNIHCGSCDKVLTDFRGKTDEEVVEIIRGSSQKVCGVFDSGQTSYKRSTVIIPLGVQRFGLSLLGILGFLGPVLTSCSDNDTVSSPEPVAGNVQQAFNKLKFPMKIEGVLKDSNSGKLMSFSKVSVLQNGKVIRTGETDKDGNFSITINKGDLKKENFEFVISRGEFADTLENYSVLGHKPGERLQLTVSATCGSSELTGFTSTKVSGVAEPLTGDVDISENGEIAPPEPSLTPPGIVILPED